MTQRALFIDRPSLLLQETVERGNPSVAVNAPALKGMAHLDPKLFRLVWIGNEDLLAYDRVPEKKHTKACAQIDAVLAKHSVRATADYACPWSMTGAPDRRKDSVFRLPNVGALKAARLEFDIDLSSSWVISDRAEAMLAGARGGARTALVLSPRNERRYDVTPDLVADDLGAAIRFLRRLQAVLSR